MKLDFKIAAICFNLKLSCFFILVVTAAASCSTSCRDHRAVEAARSVNGVLTVCVLLHLKASELKTPVFSKTFRLHTWEVSGHEAALQAPQHLGTEERRSCGAFDK